MTFPTQNPARAMQVLSDTANMHVSEITYHAANEYDTFDEKSGTYSPTFCSFYDERGSNAIESMINFLPVKLAEI